LGTALRTEADTRALDPFKRREGQERQDGRRPRERETPGGRGERR
jgi:hypothetical protein